MEFSIKLDLGKAFRKKAKQEDVSNNEYLQQLYKQLGLNVNLTPYELQDYISKGYLINPHVYTVINKIIRPASSVPHGVYKVKDESKAKLYRKFLNQNNFEEAFYCREKALEKQNLKGVSELLERPNRNQSFTEWSEQGMGFHLLTGEEFIYGQQAAGFEGYTSLYNMPPQIVTIELGNYLNPVKSYKIDFFGLTQEGIDPEKVLHIKLMNPDFSDSNHLRGMSPMQAVSRVVQKSNDSQIAMMRILQNGHPVGILASNTERGANEADMRALKQKFRQRYQGAENLNDVLLTSLNLQWIAMGMTTADMQLIESDKADLETIARVYEVPLALVKNDASTYNNLKEAQKIAWLDARLPLLKRRRDALNRWLVKDPRYYIDFDISDIEALSQNDNEQIDGLVKLVRGGIMTPNEARERRGMDNHTSTEANQLYIGSMNSINGNKL